MNDPDVLKWLDSYEGQEWLNANHRSFRFGGGYWATVKSDIECWAKSDHSECGHNAYFIWIQNRSQVQIGDLYCIRRDEHTGNRHLVIPLEPLTDEILNWSHP